MTHLGPWHTEDFDSLSWHDVHVHGFRFASFNEEEGAADFVLDTDHILKWEEEAGQLIFTICRAELIFHDAFRLKMELDYLSPTAGMSPFAIDNISREALEFSTGFKSYRWRIAVNWPHGSIEFEAPAFTQRLIGKPVVKTGAQSLSSEERANAA